MGLSKTKVLVVDDDPGMLDLEGQLLERAGFEVLRANNGQAALDVFSEQAPALVLLDLRMPVMDGFTACRRLRDFSDIPIIVVTAKEADEDKVRGFEAGADDYVTKPFSEAVLLARVRAVLKRAARSEEAARAEPDVVVDDLEINLVQHRVRKGGQEVLLSSTEYRLLSYLARNAGRILTPDQILEHVWGEAYWGELAILRTAIRRLRQRLGDDAREPRYVRSRPGIGYFLGEAGVG